MTREEFDEMRADLLGKIVTVTRASTLPRTPMKTPPRLPGLAHRPEGWPQAMPRRIVRLMASSPKYPAAQATLSSSDKWVRGILPSRPPARRSSASWWRKSCWRYPSYSCGRR